MHPADLRRKGQIRALILEHLSNKVLLSADELTASITATSRRVNRTTVYRQLQQLVIEGDVRPVQLGTRAARYERAVDHHHHIVCQRCHEVQHIEIPENLSGTIRHVRTEYGFDVHHHIFELFGLCPACQR